MAWCGRKRSRVRDSMPCIESEEEVAKQAMVAITIS